MRAQLSVPEDWEVEQGVHVPELEGARDCVELEAEERGLDVVAMFVFAPRR